MESKHNKELVDRINELAAISKTRALTDEEAKEQKKLREEYLTWFRAALRGKA